MSGPTGITGYERVEPLLPHSTVPQRSTATSPGELTQFTMSPDPQYQQKPPETQYESIGRERGFRPVPDKLARCIYEFSGAWRDVYVAKYESE